MRLTRVLLFTFALFMPCRVLAQSGSISGTVSGQDLTGVVVIACLLVNDNCDDQQSKAVQTDAKGAYRLEGLEAQPYLIIAWRDLNASGEVDAGDEVAVYSADGKVPTLVKAPLQKANLQLRVFDGNANALFGGNQTVQPSTKGSTSSELVGIWKGVDVPAQYVNVATGAFSSLSGWYGGLKLHSDGRFEFEEYQEGQVTNCHIQILTKSVGTVTVQGDALTLQPSETRETLSNGCDRSKSYQNKVVKSTAVRYGWKVSSQETLFGYRTLRLVLQPPDSRDFPLVFDRVDGTALSSNSPQSPQGWNGQEASFPTQLVSLWSSSATARLDFYNPANGVLTPPSSSVAWFRFLVDGRYEMAAFASDLVPGPGCKKSALLYERGQLNYAKDDYTGAMVLNPQVKTLIESLNDCGSDNGVRKRSLPLESEFFYIDLGRDVNGKEALEIKCSSTPEERSAWQFVACPAGGGDFRQLFSRR